MSQPIEDLFESKARAGDGSYAIAFSIMQIAKENSRLATKVGQIGFDGPGQNMGALEHIGLRIGEIASALESLRVSAIIEGSLDVTNA